jgi:hypothetical protein
MATKIQGGSETVGLANVTIDHKLRVESELNASANPNKVPALKLFSENDDGAVTGETFLLSPETDDDYRLRVSTDILLDTETFNYTAQNTGKHNYANATMAATWSAAGVTTNSGNITTTTTALRIRTYSYFPIVGSAQNYIEFTGGFTNQPVQNTLIDIGVFLDAGSNPFTPTDGAYFRLSSSGISGVVNSNGSETQVNLDGFTYTTNEKYRFLIVVNEGSANFWIDNQLYGTIETPMANSQPFMSSALPFAMRHAIVGGAAGAAISFVLNDYTFTIGGVKIGDDASFGNRVHGSYQGLSGGTMGSLAVYPNSSNPTASVPTNTTSAILTGLGGQGWETDTLAVTTDGIIMSYQNPLGTASVQGRRLVIKGVKLDGYIQTVLTGGGYNAQFSLAFGHTNVSLATTESATTKAPRRIALGSHQVASGAVALTQLATVQYVFANPIYVNPGEFFQVIKKKVGTAPSAGVIGWTILVDYTWE